MSKRTCRFWMWYGVGVFAACLWHYSDSLLHHEGFWCVVNGVGMFAGPALWAVGLIESLRSNRVTILLDGHD